VLVVPEASPEQLEEVQMLQAFMQRLGIRSGSLPLHQLVGVSGAAGAAAGDGTEQQPASSSSGSCGSGSSGGGSRQATADAPDAAGQQQGPDLLLVGPSSAAARPGNAFSTAWPGARPSGSGRRPSTAHSRPGAALVRVRARWLCRLRLAVLEMLIMIKPCCLP
jgi:hypothetical protein